MKKLTFFLALLISGLGNAQNQFLNDVKFSPGGVMDTVFDNYGNKFLLKDIVIDKDPNSVNKAVSFNDCNSGYFKLYYEIGSGFELQNDPIHIQRRNVLCRMLFDMSNFVLPVNPNTEVNIFVRSFINGTIIPPNGVTAYASPVYTIPPQPISGGGIADNVVWKTINSGIDAFYNFSAPMGTTTGSIGFYHGIMAFNFNNQIQWHQDLSACPSNKLDLYSTALHEMYHVLGFASLINEFGQSKLGINYPYFSRYDKFLKTINNENLIVSNFQNCGELYNYSFNSSVLNANAVFGSSSTCKIKFGGSVNEIVYSSPPFNNGSSLSHFEDLCHSSGVLPDNSYYLMANSSVNSQGGYFAHRFPKNEERKVLCELGYRVNNTFGSSISNNTFTYINQPICGGHPTYPTLYGGTQVVGVDDGITHSSGGSTFSFIVNGNSNIPITISNFLNNDYNPNSTSWNSITSECIQSVYQLGQITILSNNSISYLPNPNAYGVDLIRYTPVVNGLRGNVTYIYVFIRNSNCPSSTICSTYLQNGDFEMFSNCGVMNQLNISAIPRPCWNVYSATPDIWKKQCGGLYTFPQQNLNSWNGATNNNYFLGLYSIIE